MKEKLFVIFNWNLFPDVSDKKKKIKGRRAKNGIKQEVDKLNATYVFVKKNWENKK